MPGYLQLSAAAASLKTKEETLLDFQRRGWIETVRRHDTMFLASDQCYRAKYILHLYDAKHLTDEQIQLVLDVQRPPYSAAQVDQILKEHAELAQS